jgi:hypothetical protein
MAADFAPWFILIAAVYAYLALSAFVADRRK